MSEEKETMCECPLCSHCPVCQEKRMVTPAQRTAYAAAVNGPREPCPRCATIARSSVCGLCNGKNHVPPAVATLWLSQHPQQVRRASRPEMPAITFDPRKEEDPR